MRRQRLSQRALSLLLACVMFLTCAPTALAEESTEAAMMRLMKTEGTVSVTNAKGRGVSTRNDLRLHNGYGLETEEASYAWINLDDSKLVKMDAVTEIGIRKSGKKLDILLESGNLFFNVSKPLEEDESLHIRTSTMAIGIRGTCGWVKVIDQWTTLLFILEGTVEVTVVDPVTGETKTDTVKGGETVTCKVYPQDTQGGKCDIIRQGFTVDDIPGFVLVELVKNRPLCEKIKQDSGLDILGSGVDAEKRLEEDQQRVHDRLEEINRQLEEQEHNISRDPVWANPVPDGTPPSERTDDVDPGTPDRTPVTPAVNQDLVMPQTDDTVNDYLSRSDISGVTLLPGTARASTIDMLEVDSGINVPAGKTLVLRTGVRMEVLSGQTVSLGANAHVTIGGAFISAGNLTGANGATVKATGIESSIPLEDWKQSDTTDSSGYYTLTYSPKGVYTVTFNANGGTVSPTQMQTGRDSRLATLPTPSRSGYVFDGWFTAASGGEKVTTATVFSGDTTVYAHWTAATYTVTFDANGGVVTPATAGTGTDGRLTSLPTPTRTGYTFDGWFTSATGGEQITTIYVFSRDTTVYAHWTEIVPVTYTVTFDANGGTVTPATAGTGTDGRLTSLPTPTRSGFTFNGWFTAATGGTQVTTSTVFTRNTTVYAQWTAMDTGYTITFDANGGSVSPSTAATGADGKLTSLPTPTRDGYTFNGWFTAATGGTKVTTVTVFTKNTIVYAQWTEATGVTWRMDGTTLCIEGSGSMWSIEDYTTTTPPWSAQKDSITAVNIGEGVTTVNRDAFKNCTKLTSVALPDSLTSIGSSAFSGCSNLTSLTIPRNVSTIDASAFTGCTSLKTVTILGDVTSMGEYVFRNCSSLTSVDISGKLTGIPMFTFIGCTNLSSVTLPDGLTSIGREAFKGTKLTSVALPDSLTSIGSSAFYGCADLTSLTIPRNVSTIDASAFMGCTSLKTVTILGDVASMGDAVFRNCSSLTSVDISGKLTGIPMDTFLNCTNLSSVTLPDSLTSIGVEAFKGTKLTSVALPDSLTHIGYRAFYSCANLTSLTIPRNVSTIDASAFMGCTSLKTVTILGDVTSMADAVFRNCSSLTSVDISGKLTGIPMDTFLNCTNLSSVTLPDSLTSIGVEAFKGTKLTSVTLPNSLTSIGYYAFRDTALTDVYYAGTEAQWNAITIDASNTSLINATKHFNSSGRSIVSYSAPAIYTDVPATASYAEAVRYCKDNGIMTGTSDTTFSPDGTLTRAMMVTVLHRLAGKPFAYATGSFADVEPGKWYSEAISWASNQGIVNGYNPTTFGTNDPVTHEQMGLILQRYSGDQGIQVAGSDSPKSPATRAEVAMTLMNYAKGRKPGTLSEASAIDTMCAPSGIALDKDGSLFVTDVYGKQVWKVANRNGTAYAGGATVLDLYGQPMGGYNDAGLDDSFFKEPWAVAPFLDGWAVSDTANNVVRLVSSSSVKTLNGATNEKLKVTNLGVAFNGPTGLASDGEGNLYVSDTLNGAVRRVNPQGGVKTVAQNLSEPTGLCWKDGALYIAETGRNRIVKLEKGKVTTVAGSGTEGLTDGSSTEAAFASPKGVAVGNDGSVYIADTGNGAVRVVKGGTVTTLAARDPEQLSGGLMSPVGLLVQGRSLYICDTFARKIFVYQLG